MKLLAPFPERAYQSYKKGANLTTIKASFIIERLHDVFGHGNIQIEGSYRFFTLHDLRDKKGAEKINKPVVTFDGRLFVLGGDSDEEYFSGNQLAGSVRVRGVRFSIPLHGVRELDGFQDYEDLAKSARTNAVSKSVFEHLLIGLAMFKGDVKVVGDEVYIEGVALESPEAAAKKAEEDRKNDAAQIRAKVTRFNKLDPQNYKIIKSSLEKHFGANVKKFQEMSNDETIDWWDGNGRHAIEGGDDE